MPQETHPNEEYDKPEIKAPRNDDKRISGSNLILLENVREGIVITEATRMINVSMASWLQAVHGIMSRVRRMNRLTANAVNDRQEMITDTVFCLFCKIFLFNHASDILIFN